MKNSLWISFLLALLVSGCSQEDVLRNQPSIFEGRVFTTSFEQNESRTYVEEGTLLRWTSGDQISLFDGNTLNRQYQFDGKTGDNSGTFSIFSKPYGTGNDLTKNYAVYPYDKDVRITEGGIITTILPSKQNYADNSFGLGANTMVAVTEDTDDTFLYFKNVCGHLNLQLYGDDVTVKSITLRGNNGEKIAGKASIAVVYGEEPIVSMSDDATQSITLNCGKGVKINNTADDATTFWMVLPPTVFEKGITVTVKDINDRMFVQTTANELEIERNVIKRMTAVEVNPEIPYLTFVANDVQTLTMSKAVDRLEYSVNGGGWNELGTNTVEFGGEQGILRLRGKNLNGTVLNDEFSTIHFGKEALVACSGDIRTLLDYENFKTVDTRNAQFCWLFADCASLISAPELPATELAEGCYRGMFNCCSNLTEAPALPATKLSLACYAEMFVCTNLVKAPELPAKTLANYCYGHMFSGCTNLTQASALPATELSYECYRAMFQGCINLVESPELPATTLAEGCYSNMFADCANLAEAPVLPATELAKACYQYMFIRCSALTQAPVLPAITLAQDCYLGMFRGCTGFTKAPALPATTLAVGCYREMFQECTNLVEAPALPATNLAGSCYSIMFAYCNSLTHAPILPASTLANDCYWLMFLDCSNLQDITMLATDISAGGCFDEWVSGVSTTGTFIKAAEMTSLPVGMNGIPDGWTVKDYAE